MAKVVAGRYRMERMLDSADAVEVWLADDLEEDRRVVLKRLRTARPGGLDPAIADRIVQEASAVARLQNPYIVALYDVIEIRGEPTLVMEYVEGETLGERIRREEHLPLETAAPLVADIAQALAAAHRAGIVHGAVSPDNIVLDASGTARLADFGVARGLRDAALLADDESLPGASAYLAPEVESTGSPVAPSDVWSLGATLYTAIEGSPPFGDEADEPAKLAAVGQPPPAQHAGDLANLVQHMLGSRPSSRMMAILVADRLHAWAADHGIPSHAPLVVAGRQASLASAQATAAVAAEPSSAADGDAAPQSAQEGDEDEPKRSESTFVVLPPPTDAGAKPRRKSLLWPLAALLAACAALVLVLVTTNGNSGTPSATADKTSTAPPSTSSPPPSSPTPVVVTVPTPTRACVGRTCTFSVTGVHAGDELTWNFGDGIAKAGGAHITHMYKQTGAHVTTVAIKRAGVTGLSAPLRFTIAAWARSVSLSGGGAGNYQLNAEVSAPLQCRGGRYTLQRNDGAWTNVANGALTTGQTSITAPSTGTFRVVLAESGASGGVCFSATSNTVSVEAAPPVTTPPQTTTTITTTSPHK